METQDTLPDYNTEYIAANIVQLESLDEDESLPVLHEVKEDQDKCEVIVFRALNDNDCKRKSKFEFREQSSCESLDDTDKLHFNENM